MLDRFRKNSKILFGFTLTMLLAGCGEASYLPVSIDEAVDVCAECNMSVQDNSFAAQLVNQGGEVLKFDDIGCLAQYLNGRDSESGKAYVRDFPSLEWVTLEESHFIHSTELTTPMNYGFAAFKKEEDKEQFSKKYENVGWEEVQQLAKEKKGMKP